MRTDQLADHHVLVTGAAQGVGRTVAETFREAGAEVTAVDRDDAVRELEVAAGGDRGEIHARVVDLGSEESLASLVRHVETTEIDLLVNCAAAYPHGDLLGTTDADWVRVLQVNVVAAAALSRAMSARLVRAGKPGAIVNVGSVQEDLPVPEHSAYVASKAALSGMTKALALELGEHGIRVNSVKLGLVQSEALAAKLGGDLWSQHGITPPTLLRRTGTTAEAADAIAFLCSSSASYITGAELAVDGGRRISRLPDPQTQVGAGHHHADDSTVDNHANE